jgi:hypothetical protein
VPPTWLGLAYAVASGLMLGVGHALLVEGLRFGATPLILGACLGVVYTHWTHARAGTMGLDALSPEGTGGPLSPLLVQSALHAASEGVAIGAAMALNGKLGAFMALALAMHNAAEGLALAAHLLRRRLSLPASAALAVITKLPQIPLAALALVLSGSVAGSSSWLLGFAAGTLVFLTMTELLPAAYHSAQRRVVALTISVFAGAVVLVRELLA